MQLPCLPSKVKALLLIANRHTRNERSHQQIRENPIINHQRVRKDPDAPADRPQATAVDNLPEAEDLQVIMDHRTILRPLREGLRTNQSRETPQRHHVNPTMMEAVVAATMEVVVVAAVEIQVAEEVATTAAAAEAAVILLMVLLVPWLQAKR